MQQINAYFTLHARMASANCNHLEFRSFLLVAGCRFHFFSITLQKAFKHQNRIVDQRHGLEPAISCSLFSQRLTRRVRIHLTRKIHFYVTNYVSRQRVLAEHCFTHERIVLVLSPANFYACPLHVHIYFSLQSVKLIIKRI